MKFEEFAGQTVFITGGASGIGKAQAISFLKNGANVFVLDKAEENLKEMFKQYENSFDYAVGSITDKTAVQQSVRQAIKNFKQIDILLNTAGVLDGYAKTLETEEQLWDKIMNTNVKGTYFVTNSVLPHMLQNERGVIINMASIAGIVAGGGGAAYTASKHAIIGYTKQLDYDYCRNGVRANAIAPGAIKTPMNKADFAGDGQIAKWVAEETPAGRWADPSEVADLTLFLASKATDYIHGAVIPIDGGWTNK
ncbi:3-oxoacyl-ACP reductase [Virgibacillus proomii]|uniref:3-oxoacyl-ACP reductase n=1 Tax=Virgibacillus proomii TaxID=84407 RepID=UPI001C103AF4|nr:3-oxoacyl-ACP reductase [Virgibacillus proomii]MBU5266806.1 3-oxoacyl-ACP reductase [Virgibacillus proomii]MBU5266812.1 3-oxoacyl-ACP reductase [Virgibacillus proomii]